ncbi:MAG TPA: GNAT family N-acetyltransferase [Terriglobales bacterium]|nr:GNAT family N-acetyltransferase [Terriglobales bacterium]
MGTATPNPAEQHRWITKKQSLDFRLGPLRLGSLGFRASVLTTPFIQLPEQVSSTVVIRSELSDCAVAVIPAHPDLGHVKTIQKLNGLVRYVSFTEMRYLVDLRGSLSDYLAQFSAKRRKNLLRTVKKLTEFSGGRLECREFHSPEKMLEFQRIAVEISQKTYKQKIGWAFQSSASFGQELAADAAAGAVRGYVLYSDGVSAAYAFCRVQDPVIYYTHIGYDPRFSEYSPGTVLLFMLIERLFGEHRYMYLDFLGGAYWQYKQVFSTVHLPSATLFYFPPSPKNILVIMVHLAVRKLEAGMARLKRFLKSFRSSED